MYATIARVRKRGNANRSFWRIRQQSRRIGLTGRRRRAPWCQQVLVRRTRPQNKVSKHGANMTIDRLKRPTVALGTWAWGDSGQTGDGYFGSPLTRAGLEEVADKAHAAGFTLWDTAMVYGMGRSETVLGEVLKRLDRGDYQLSTKFTPQAVGTGDDPVADMLEQSLARLGTDYIDLYWIHNPADVARWTPCLIPLLKSGNVRHVGVSNHNLGEIELANRILGEAGFRVEAVQNHYSLLYRSSEDAGILDYCRDQGIPFFAYMVLEQGALTGKYSPQNPLPEGSSRAKAYNGLLPQLKALTDKLASIGQKQGAAAPDVATAWAIAKGATPIIGVTKPGYIDGLVRATSMTLPSDDIAELEALAIAADVNTRGWWEKAMDV
ncbi:aldo/keto reductase [Mesorhizobium sp.]|uniref:aldo/keto reductase n=1 Tax=Mesorhizobium sp. TaxID=1871066 RepID=UPI0025BA79AE|nr:aldo/keto reductase [Mesorhizobium sp.]